MTGPAGARHRVVVTTFAFRPGFRGGGPVKSVEEVLDRLEGTARCLLVTSDRDLGDAEPYPGLRGRLVARGGHDVYYLDRSDPRHWLRALRLARRARPDVLYLNSFWSPPFTVLPVLATLLGLIRPRRVLLAPRGELSPGALALKGARKRAFLVVWSRLLRRAGTTFHASTDLEARHVGAVLPWARSVVQLNSAGPPPRTAPVAPEATARFVFLGRLSRKKNLGLALDALSGAAVPVQLDVYGPVEDRALWAGYTRAVDRMPPHVTVRYRGELAPASVAGTLARYDAFVLPTLGENFGHVVAESLAAGCPVICSAETPWTPVLTGGGGAVVASFDAAAWRDALETWASAGVDERLHAKHRALEAYRRWRADATERTAVEVLLEELDGAGRTPAAGAPALPARLRAAAVARARRGYRRHVEPALRRLGTPGRQRVVFLLHQRRVLRLARPRTFSDLVLRRVVHDRSPELVWVCDKLAQKERVRAMATTARVVPTLWSGVDADGLLTADLPAHWVLKRNDSSGWVHLGRGPVTPSQLDGIRRGAGANTTPFERNGEWGYSRARRLLLVEPHLGPPDAVLNDYKVFVFSGRAVLVQAHTGRSAEHRMSHFDRDWHPLAVRTSRPRCDDVPAPVRLAEMLRDAETIADGFDFLRVDFYEVDGELWFGETTAYPAGGLRRFRPYAFDRWLGRRWMQGDRFRPDLHHAAGTTP